MASGRKRRFGDRRDGFRVKAPGLQTVMTCLMPKRTDSEVFVSDKIDVTELLRYLEQKNEQDPSVRRTLFHCVVTAMARTVRERPLLNRFIQGATIYERYEISLAFVVKRRFADHAEESLMFLTPEDSATLDDISRRIVGDVKEIRKSEHATGGVDALLDRFAAMPRLLRMFLVRIIRYLDFWGVNPRFITEGDPNYASVFLSNLGSIGCPSVYHHLNNYGSNSIMITIGTIHREALVDRDGKSEVREIVDIGATLDERIADGFYFARSLKLVKHICANPQLLDLPLSEPSGFRFE